MRDFFRTLAGRVVLVTAATAVIAVIVTALVALPIAVRSANNAARTDLVEKSQIAVELLRTERPAVREKIVAQLRQDGISVYLLRNGKPDKPGLPDRVIQQMAAGRPVTMRGVVNNKVMLIAGQPLDGDSAGVVLTRAAASGTAGKVLGGVWIALLAGLTGAILAGALLARFIARPIKQAAIAAARISAGTARCGWRSGPRSRTRSSRTR